jgi:hypothetical protein
MGYLASLFGEIHGVEQGEERETAIWRRVR